MSEGFTARLSELRQRASDSNDPSFQLWADEKEDQLWRSNREAILALVEAAEKLARGHQGCTQTSGCGVAALRPLLEALNG